MQRLVKIVAKPCLGLSFFSDKEPVEYLPDVVAHLRARNGGHEAIDRFKPVRETTEERLKPGVRSPAIFKILLKRTGETLLSRAALFERRVGESFKRLIPQPLHRFFYRFHKMHLTRRQPRLPFQLQRKRCPGAEEPVPRLVEERRAVSVSPEQDGPRAGEILAFRKLVRVLLLDRGV